MQCSHLLLSGMCLALFTQPRLVHFQNFGFFTLDRPTLIYHQIEYSRASFTLTIPSYRATIPRFTKIEDMIKELDIPILYQTDEPLTSRQILLRSLLVDFQDSYFAFKEKLYELFQYKAKDPPIDTYPCHGNFSSILNDLRIELLERNIETYLSEIPENVTYADLVSSTDVFLILEELYRTLLGLMQTHHYNVNSILESVQALSRGEVSPYLFDLLKQTPCHAANPHPDFLLYNDCSFSSYSITCQLVVENPTKAEKIGKIMPIPYNGYEISNLQNVYLNFSSEKLVSLFCQHKMFLTFNCHRHPVQDTPCVTALNSNHFPSIVQSCYFQPSSIQTPTLTRSGILIPYSANISVYLQKNETRPNDLTYWNIFKDRKAPVLINSPYNMTIKDDIFTYTFKQFGTDLTLLTTAYTDEDLEMLTDYIHNFMDNLFPVTNENILILTQIGVSGLVFLFASLFCVYCVKFRRKTRILDELRPRDHKKIFKSKQLRKFASTSH